MYKARFPLAENCLDVVVFLFCGNFLPPLYAKVISFSPLPSISRGNVVQLDVLDSQHVSSMSASRRSCWQERRPRRARWAVAAAMLVWAMWEIALSRRTDYTRFLSISRPRELPSALNTAQMCFVRHGRGAIIPSLCLDISHLQAILQKLRIPPRHSDLSPSCRFTKKSSYRIAATDGTYESVIFEVTDCFINHSRHMRCQSGIS